MKENVEKLIKFTDEVKSSGASVGIIMHDIPDPDSMGSAVGLQLILKSLDIESTIYLQWRDFTPTEQNSC